MTFHRDDALRRYADGRPQVVVLDGKEPALAVWPIRCGICDAPLTAEQIAEHRESWAAYPRSMVPAPLCDSCADVTFGDDDTAADAAAPTPSDPGPGTVRSALDAAHRVWVWQPKSRTGRAALTVAALALGAVLGTAAPRPSWLTYVGPAAVVLAVCVVSVDVVLRGQLREAFWSALARATVWPGRRVPIVWLEMPVVYVGDAIAGYVVPAWGDDTAWQYAPVDDSAPITSAEYATPECAALALAAAFTPPAPSARRRVGKAVGIAAALTLGAVLGTIAAALTGGWPL